MSGRIVLLCTLLAGACATTQTTTLPAGTRPATVEDGLASWYAPTGKLRATASGEWYSPGQYTAAHRKFPFGTRVLVENLRNGKRTIVRINDRGPYGKCVIDLSLAAAKALDMLEAGVVPVRLIVVP